GPARVRLRAERHAQLGETIDLEQAEPLVGGLLTGCQRQGQGGRARPRDVRAAEKAPPEGVGAVQVEHERRLIDERKLLPQDDPVMAVVADGWEGALASLAASQRGLVARQV